ncbi:hypothetical protein [Lyngbya sp. CCY1209]|uniref:hypothetical protein n=1 Tax=Lyngbya sp. CCY1209 TaxID=2886103 RepID=UPI002D1FD748|nr:hypothetical protein [Lyngbya sp. CCY1209]MEB3882469.1 hypothetical protein [Lyngbya sp. CCY1209]
MLRTESGATRPTAVAGTMQALKLPLVIAFTPIGGRGERMPLFVQLKTFSGDRTELNDIYSQLIL